MVSAADILNRIQSRSEQLWGEKWIANLTRAYVEIAKRDWSDETATTVNRRPQIERAFKNGGCNADTLLILLEAVGGKLAIEWRDEL